MSLEYRIRWSASSNINFKGATDWEPWDGMDDDVTSSEVEQELCEGGALCEGLETALEASGFEWYVEVREVQS